MTSEFDHAFTRNVNRSNPGTMPVAAFNFSPVSPLAVVDFPRSPFQDCNVFGGQGFCSQPINSQTATTELFQLSEFIWHEPPVSHSDGSWQQGIQEALPSPQSPRHSSLEGLQTPFEREDHHNLNTHHLRPNQTAAPKSVRNNKIYRCPVAGCSRRRILKRSDNLRDHMKRIHPAAYSLVKQYGTSLPALLNDPAIQWPAEDRLSLGDGMCTGIRN
ncbi:hypothetical protein BDZ91DRAFT_789682 [Kalaharituber pfeilii]|nr:hypothetical protein BDZ91DRAFT_789682 [Kalaharituber pfeilii]